MEVINDIVGKDLKIYQDNEFFKFSLESILLPNFVANKGNVYTFAVRFLTFRWGSPILNQQSINQAFILCF